MKLEITTVEEHERFARGLLGLRRRMGAVTTRALSGRVPARVLDAALEVGRRLDTLALRLADAAGDAAAGLYTPDSWDDARDEAPSVAVPTPGPACRRSGARRGARLGADEHRAVGAELYRLRRDVQALAAELGRRFRKSSGVGRALRRPERALDRLRCRLDGLFCLQHPAQFDTRAYYPGAGGGSGAAPPPAGHARAAGEAP